MKKEVPLYMKNADNFVTCKPDRRFYRGIVCGLLISCVIVCVAIGVTLLGDWILDFWRIE